MKSINKILQMKLENKIINLVYPYLLTTFPLLIFAASIFVFKIHAEVDKNTLYIWYGLVLIASFFQAIIAAWFQVTKYSLKWDHLYFKVLIINALVVAGLWGVASYLIMPADPVGQTYFILVISFIATGGLIYLAGSYLVGSLYLSCILLPLAASVYSLRLNSIFPNVYTNATMGIILYWVFLLCINYYGSKLYLDNIIQRILNKKANDELSYLNDELAKMHNTDEQQTIATVTTKNIIPQKQTLSTDCDSKEVMAIKFEQARAYARRHHQGLGIFVIEVINKQQIDKKLMSLVLKNVTVKLRNCKREPDILSYIDKNKFVLIVAEIIFGDEIKAVVNRIFKTLSADILDKDKKIQISVNIGISLFPIDGYTLEELLAKSEIALSNSTTAEEELLYKIYDSKTMNIN